MSEIKLTPSKLKGEVFVPSSKSIGHRAIIAASLANGESIISNLDMSQDITATIECMKTLGSKIYKDELGRLHIDGTDTLNVAECVELDCNESGSTLRFLMPLSLLSNQEVKFKGKGKLMERPQKPYFDLFEEKGIRYEKTQEELVINGELKAGEYSLPGDVSSQFITGLLFTLPLLSDDSIINVTTELESKSYVDITIDVLKSFSVVVENENQEHKKFLVKGNQKYESRKYEVERDFSQSAFFMVAGAVGNDIICKGLNKDSKQGDKEIINILRKAGAKVEIDGENIKITKERIRPLVIDAKDIPDLVPILAILCTFCEGESTIINAGRLRLKESDRLNAITTELNKLGAKIEELKDSLKIQGVENLKGGIADSWGDHRIAMALAIAATRCEEEVIIKNSEAVNKSYPKFWEDYMEMRYSDGK